MNFDEFKSQASWLQQARKKNETGEQAVSDRQIMNTLIQQRPELSQPYNRLVKSTKEHPLAATKFLNYTFYGDANYEEQAAPPKSLSLGGLVKTDTSYLDTSDPSRYSIQDLQSTIGKPETIDEGIRAGIKGGVVGSLHTGYNVGKSIVDLATHPVSTLMGAAAIPAGGVEEALAWLGEDMIKQFTGEPVPEDKKAPMTPERQQFRDLMQNTGITDLLSGIFSGNKDKVIIGADTALNFAYQRPLETALVAEGGVRAMNKATGKAIPTPLEVGGKITQMPAKAIKAMKKSSSQQNMNELIKKYGSEDNIPLNELDKVEFNRVQAEKSPFIESVQEKLSTKEIRDLRAKKPELVQEGKFFKKGKVLPSTVEQKLGEVAQTVKGYNPKDTPISRAKVIHKALGDESQALRTNLEKNNAALPRAEAQSAVNNSLMERAKDFPGSEGIFNRMGELWKQISSKHPGNLTGAWDARIELYKTATDRWGEAIFQKGSPQAQALNAASQTVNQVIETAARRAGTSFAPEIARVNSMYEILRNLSTQGEGGLSSGIGKLLKNPWVRVGAQTAGVGAAVSAGIPLAP